MAVTTAIISGVSAVGSGVAAAGAAKAQNKAQKKAARLERAQAERDRLRETRRAIAQRRVQQAELIQSGETGGARTNSALSGAVGSLSSTTAGNIGAANTQTATQLSQNQILTSGASRAARLGGVSSLFQGVGSASYAVAGSKPLLKKLPKFF